MAEVYGVKPKLFTKEWWPYFWEYYKWHTIWAIGIIIAIIITIIQFTDKGKYDLVVTYCGTEFCSEEQSEKLTNSLEDVIEDVNGDDEKHIRFDTLTINGIDGMDQQDYTIRMKHDLDFADELHYLYMYSEDELEKKLNIEYYDELYLPVDEWNVEEIPDDLLVRGDDGKPYAVSFKNCRVLKDCGIDGSLLYVTVKNDSTYKNTNEKVKNSAFKMAEKLIK